MSNLKEELKSLIEKNRANKGTPVSEEEKKDFHLKLAESLREKRSSGKYINDMNGAQFQEFLNRTYEI